MSSGQTLARFRDFWYPGLIDRRRRPEWLERGGTTLAQRLNARVREIIREHRPEPLPAPVLARIKEIVAQAG
jgi:trimethylamine:corrinoid methyltransferase-like protein